MQNTQDPLGRVTEYDTRPGGSGRAEFLARLTDLAEELRDMERRPLRLSDIDARFERLGGMEDEGLLSEEQYHGLPSDGRKVVDEFASLLVRQRSMLRDAYADPGVLSDMVAVLETRWSAKHSGRAVPRAVVLAAVRGRSSDSFVDAVAMTKTVRGAVNGTGCALLKCEEWFLDLLRDSYGTKRLASVHVDKLSADEVEAVVALWDEDLSSDFHRLHDVVEAVRRIG